MLQRQLSRNATSPGTSPAATSDSGSRSGGFGRTLGRSSQDRVGNSTLAARGDNAKQGEGSGAAGARRPVVPTIYHGPPKRGPDGPDTQSSRATGSSTSGAPATDGVLRAAKVRSGQEGALIGTGGPIALASAASATDSVTTVPDGSACTVTQVKGDRLRVRVRSGTSTVEGWVAASVFSDQPGLTRDEADRKLPDDYVYSRQAGDHSPVDPKGKDTAQGAIGDCFFIASMAAVANASPGTIAEMVKYDAQKKTYTVRFFEETGRGPMKPVYIEVDGFLPTSPGSRNDPAYAGDPGGKLWPAVIEKAYAKWKGGYHAIGEGGTGEQALAEITGARSQYRSPSSMKESEVIPYFQQAKKDGKAIYAGVMSGMKSTQQQVLQGSADGPYRGTLKQTHRWNHVIPGSVRVTDTKGKAPSARDVGREGDESGKLTGRGVKSGTIGYKSSALDLSFDAGKGPTSGTDLEVSFDYEGVLDVESFLIGNHAYAFEGVVQGDKLQFYNPWGTYQPKPITASTFLRLFDSIALNQAPSKKTKA